VVTVLAVELAYDTRISLRIAANARDELRASYQARSALALARLVLHFQQRLDAAGQVAGQALGGAAGPSPVRSVNMALRAATAPAGTTGTGGMPGGTPSFSIRLWDAIPIDSMALGPLLGPERSRGPGAGAAAGGDTGGKGGRAAAPSTGTSFQANIEDEDRKVNVAQLAGLSTVAAPQLQRFLLLVRDPRYDVLFDREDANGNRFTRKDVAVALKDWVDEDSTTSAIGVNPASPFENGFGDENQSYDRGDDRYRAKNARFDSLDELYMAAGIGDAFMAAFGDQLTVYPDVNAQTNVNTSDPNQMLVNALLMSDPPGVPQPPLLDPAFPQKIDLALRLARPIPFMTITVQQFATVLQALGVKVQPIFLQGQNTDTRSAFGNRSSTFTIRATGRAGEVEKTIEAVVTTDDRAGGLATDLGRLIHWRED